MKKCPERTEGLRRRRWLAEGLQQKKNAAQTFVPWQHNSLLRGVGPAYTAADPRAAGEKNDLCVFVGESDRHHLFIFEVPTWGPHPWQGCRVAVWFSFIPWSIHRWFTLELRIWKMLYSSLIYSICYYFISFLTVPVFSLAPDSPRRRTRCCCTSSSLGKRCPGTTQSFYTADSSSERPSGRCPHSRYHGSARARFTTNVNLEWKMT